MACLIDTVAFIALLGHHKTKYIYKNTTRPFILQQNDKQPPSQKLSARLGIHIKYTDTDAAYQYRNGINQFRSQKCFTYFLMQHDLQSFCK